MAACSDSSSLKMQRILFNSSNTVVLAHRGLWGKYAGIPDMPENSRGSLQTANDQCMDGVELDVKLTSDGVPVLLHDYNLGRTTTVWQHHPGVKYDPITNQGVNPSILVTPWSEVSQLFLLTPDRRTTTGYHVPRVDELFTYYKQHNLRTPMVFDIKDAKTVRAVNNAANKVFGVASGSYVAAKVNATLYTSRDAYRADGNGMAGIPVFTTNMLGKINVGNVISAWIEPSETMEINVKQLNGQLQGNADFLRERGIRVGVFQAIPDGPRPGEFYQNSGACCYKLSNLYYGSDTADNRGDIDYVGRIQAFGLITTDDPKAAIAYLRARGKHD
ncbi:glycerophosphodiester phosphodiesterase family protein [Xanthomonas campestris pv. campestris]|uniref:glycerophosphodiester phosphodiesterase family protein n=1 Tax=Xanthomonas campestris TaxID=339 RepID=UPI00094AF232|nr:glycerophosphodiester phosphodiesterase family protein [Xanthomonas campestris]MDM7670318.1 glycerophosphodiester phosphodiesterase family protein [Xanthomonas campestris pv. campestris]MDM7691642.1 glycerophosphodiester phosphodiesterase family protein [Xanthomonas campestris pv. campestris]MDM7694674.1 glycerophosphodiester phosphodiesterase family protein [Xanthomonas campestris pv. campestris]MDM7713093.1 glycerophosphodiester phosphodiesterase family protein [Xanthomonas campestris pv. 